MQKQTTQLTSKQWVDQMLREHYEKARQAKAEGRLVCWSTLHCPPGTADHHGHCDHVSGKPRRRHRRPAGHRALHLLHGAAGYSSDLCSYARVNLAYSKIQHSEAENMPMPDSSLCTTQHLPHGDQVV